MTITANTVFTVVPYKKLFMHAEYGLCKYTTLAQKIILQNSKGFFCTVCGMKFTCCSRELKTEGSEDCCRIRKLAPNGKNYFVNKCGWHSSVPVWNETLHLAALIS